MQRLVPPSTLLLVIDVQEALVYAMPPARMEGVTRAIQVLVAAAARLGAPILWTEQYPKGLKATIAPLAEKLAEAGARPIEKTSFSACDAPAFVEALEKAAPSAVIVVGMESHVCVYQSVRDLALRGLDVYVASDAVVSRRDEDRAAGLALCERAGAVVTTAETVVFDWLRRAGTDEFRALSKLVR
ncbi:MAG TPA: isochorismatase family protein [Polyangiaceae bacterium]|nr:isochorismatase family protein [Polyangiaceae bacterium]